MIPEVASVNSGKTNHHCDKVFLKNLGTMGILVFLASFSAGAGLLHVSPLSQNPVSPFSNWLTAATSIQDAVDAAQAGDSILVSNGVYRTGGRVVAGDAWANRVAVTKPVVIRSLNGPDVTVIEGYLPPERTNYESAIRCVSLAPGAILSGFTLTNGGSAFGGGAFCAETAILSNCVITGNSASRGGGVAYGNLVDCVLSNNWADIEGGGVYGLLPTITLRSCKLISNATAGSGGGASGGTYKATDCILKTCTLVGNRAFDGGGASGSTLIDCALTNNMAMRDGGGADSSILQGCVLFGNWATNGAGGGVSLAAGTIRFMANCLVMSNSAHFGGGVGNAWATNCLIANNTADSQGGGAAYGIYVNCTIVLNTAGEGGGGIYDAYAYNCIVYSNNWDEYLNLPAPWWQKEISYCCTTPLPDPALGVANIDLPPLFANFENGDFHLRPDSPCRDAGFNDCIARTLTDLDGWMRVVHGSVDIGAYEFQTQPRLQILLSGDKVVLSWPRWASNYVLETITEISPEAAWTPLSNEPVTSGANCFVTNSLNSSTALYRVHGP